MPERNVVTALKQLCLAYVANNIDALCCDHAKLEHLDQRLLNSIPLKLPGNAACLNHMLKHNHKPFLIRVPFWSGAGFRITSLLDKIGKQGDGVVELRFFDFLSSAFYPDLISTLSRLPRLQRLTLKLVTITESVVAAVTLHCTQLTEVSLSGTCLSEDCLDLFSACTNIEVLVISCNIPNPYITAARSLQVLGLPRLRIFKCEILTQAIRLLDVSTRLALTEYTELNHRYLRPLNTLSHVFRVCPLLTSVHLNVLGDEDLTGLQWLSRLRVFSLYLSPIAPGINFRIDIQLVLSVIGSNLTKLRLRLSNLDFGSVTTYCTALEELEICQLKWIRNYDDRQLAPLTELRNFKLSLKPTTLINAHIPGQIIGAFGTRLKRLDLEKCHLSDARFKQLLDSGRLDDLESMRLVNVCCLTTVSLGRLILRPGPFKVLYVFFCRKISEQDIDNLRVIIRVLNLNVTIHNDIIELTS